MDDSLSDLIPAGEDRWPGWATDHTTIPASHRIAPPARPTGQPPVVLSTPVIPSGPRDLPRVFLVFNTILNFDNLNAGRKLDAR